MNGFLNYWRRFKTALRLSPLQKRVSGSNAYQIALFSAFQKGVSNPIIKTALRLLSAKITLSRLETLILHHKSGDKRTLLSAPLKSVSKPLIKTALRLSSPKITLKVVWKP